MMFWLVFLVAAGCLLFFFKPRAQYWMPGACCTLGWILQFHRVLGFGDCSCWLPCYILKYHRGLWSGTCRVLGSPCFLGHRCPMLMVLTLPTSTLPVFLNIEGGWLSGGEPVLILVFLSAIWRAAFWLVFTAVLCNMNFWLKNDVLVGFPRGSWMSAFLLQT